MTKYFSNAFGYYLTNYSGVPSQCWPRISLTLLNSTAGGVNFFLSYYYVNILHFNMATAGLIVSCYGLGSVAGGIIGGKLSDQIAPGIISVLSLLIKGIIFFTLIKTSSISFLVCDIFLLGFTTYSFIASNNVWILEQCNSFETIRLKVINILYTASNLGIALAAIIVSVLSRYNFTFIFLLSGSLLLFSVFYFLLQERRSVYFAHTQKIPAKPIAIESLAKKNKTILLLVLSCVFGAGLMLAQLSSTYPVYLQHIFPQLGVKSSSYLFIVSTLIIVFFQAPVVNVFHNFNKVIMLGVGAFLLGFGMLILVFAFDYLLAIIATIVFTVGEMLLMSMAQLICYQYGATRKKGQSLGTYQTVYATGVVIGPTLGGNIYHYLGANMVWYSCGLIGVMCLTLCYCFNHHYHD